MSLFARTRENGLRAGGPKMCAAAQTMEREVSSGTLFQALPAASSEVLDYGVDLGLRSVRNSSQPHIFRAGQGSDSAAALFSRSLVFPVEADEADRSSKRSSNFRQNGLVRLCDIEALTDYANDRGFANLVHSPIALE
jgi:hypothetical protein